MSGLGVCNAIQTQVEEDARQKVELKLWTESEFSSYQASDSNLDRQKSRDCVKIAGI